VFRFGSRFGVPGSGFLVRGSWFGWSPLRIERRTPNGEPRTANRERRTANGEPRTANREREPRTGTANAEPSTSNLEPNQNTNGEARTEKCERQDPLESSDPEILRSSNLCGAALWRLGQRGAADR
jgi:hypothetical protein